MSETMVEANGVAICTESFGDRADPPMLLIMGATASMDWWPEEFCRRLAGLGRFVVRYDARDTGRSACYQPGPIPYTLDDLAGDAVGVLDAYGIDRAHVVGLSMGGMVAQLVAFEHPERVRSLTLMMTQGFVTEGPDIPPMDPKIADHFAGAAGMDWSDRDTVVEFRVEGWRLISGTAHPFDEAVIRATSVREFERATRPASMMNHALLTGGEHWRDRLDELHAPSLVIHGTADLVVPHGHGVRLARAIPGAALLSLEGTGHELHPADWDGIIDAIARHTAIAIA